MTFNFNSVSNSFINPGYSLVNDYLSVIRWNALTIFHTPEVSTATTFADYNLATYLYLYNITVFVILATLCVFFVLTYGARLLTNLAGGYDLSYTIFTYFTEFEEEMGSSDDGVAYYLIYALIIVWFFGFFLFTAYFSKQITWIITLLVLSTLTAFIVPTTILKDYGLAFVAYVRGHGRTASSVYEALLDVVSVSIIIIRFLIQNLRFVFIFFAFFEIYEYVYQSLSFFTALPAVFDTTALSSILNKAYSLTFLLNTLSTWILYIYYVGHLTILFIAQLAVYFALSFWLFFFLYTSFVLETHEKYFTIMRS